MRPFWALIPQTDRGIAVDAGALRSRPVRARLAVCLRDVAQPRQRFFACSSRTLKVAGGFSS